MTTFDTNAPLLPEILSLHGKWKGSKTALICEDNMVSWAELNGTTNRIANGLIAAGIKPGDMVGILMQNGQPMVEAILGIMKSGGCSVPINLSVTDDAIASMMLDADVKAIIATDTEASRLTNFLEKNQSVTLYIAGENNATFSTLKNSHPATKPAPYISDNSPLNVIYSSGTTGSPKGILHTHKGRRDWAYDMAIALRYHGGSRTLFNLGLYSNISWVGFLATLVAGGTLIVQPAFDTTETLKAIEKHRVTNFSMVPIQYQRLLEDPDQANYDLSSIQAVMSCGSPLHAELKQALFNRFGPVIIELFGLTEGVITTLDPEEAEGRMASVGKPLIGTDIKIIDSNGHEVSAEKSGEIVANGRILMPGYLNRPDATVEASWTDPDGNTWLRTGDIGQLDQEGYLYIVDRKKDMILSGGQNIYPQDIEAVLITHNAVNEVAVIGAKSSKWGETPVAIVVLEKGANADADTLGAWANEKLGKQQRIAAIEFTDALPRNPNGKILKRELRDKYRGLSFG
jgi:acyl-CoA synthetase (AMP-forming)/AMP-acid ligase II